SSKIEVTHIASLKQVKKQKSLEGFDGVIVDYDLDTTTGFVVAEFLNTQAKNKPVVMVSSTTRPEGEKLTEKLPNIKGFVSKWSYPADFMQKVIQTLKS
ncbi:MAG: response regulator, partial [Proteobacteria bacterium]